MDIFWIAELAALLLGLLLGSFLNVCIARVPKGESVVRPGSRCPRCGRPIRWHDNIPVLSWLLLRGRCRGCGQPISVQYPAVELGVAFWFAYVVLRCFTAAQTAGMTTEAWASLILTGIGLAVLGYLLIGLMVMDWRTMLLPDAFTWTGILIAFLLTCIRAFFLNGAEDQIVLSSTHQLRMSSPGSFAAQGNVFMTGPEHLLGVWALSTLGVAALLLVIRWLYKLVRHREGMGLGDVKLLALIAAFLGFRLALLALFAGVFAATLYAVALLARRKAGAETRLPLGSFLAAGGLFAACLGEPILSAYLALLH